MFDVASLPSTNKETYPHSSGGIAQSDTAMGNNVVLLSE